MADTEFETSFEEEEDLNTKSVEQLRKALKEKGLSIQGKKKLLIKRLVKASEESKSLANNHKEKPSNIDNNKPVHTSPPNDEGDINNSTCTTSKLRIKILKGDVEALSMDVYKLSQSSNNNIKMKMRAQRLEDCRLLCLDLRENFISSIEEDDIETKLYTCKEILKEIDKAIDIAQEYIEKEICKSSAESIATSSKDTRQNLKLPKIELPTYDGDLLKFQNFWDQFEAAVHKNDDLPDIQKFTYLRSVLKGSALQTVDGFEVTGANYSSAVEALMHRYGRKRVIISSLIKSMINLEATTEMSAQALRELHDTLKNRTRALEALGELPNTHACILLPMFETKLPPRLLEKWELELTDVADDKIELDRFFKFLNRQLVSKEAGERNTKSTSSLNSEKNQQTNASYSARIRADKKPATRQERMTTASTLHATCNTNPVCILCKSNHELAECKELSKKSISERWQIVKLNKVCFNCLKPSHKRHYSKNCRQPKCSEANCGKPHHQLLHENPTPTLNGFASTNLEKPMETLLPTAIAELSANGQTIQARVLLDSGSQRSYIRKTVAEAVGLRGPTESISVTTLGGNTSETKRLQRVKFSLSAVNDQSPDNAVTIEALAIPKICNQLGPVTLNLNDHTHLRNLNFADSYPRDSVEVDVLIGADFYYSFVTGNCIKGSSRNSPTAVESVLGWILTGPVVSASQSTTSMFAVVENTEITRTLKRFWELEAIGIAPDECQRQSKEEQCAVEDFNRGLKFDGSNYEVQLPWKPNHADLTNNYQQALKRLEGVERKLHRDPVKAKAYSDAINQYVEKGFAEEVPDKESNCKNVRYLPHHAVFRDDKTTTKCRIVFDASAKDEQDVSLNDCILPGPALQPNLASVLIRFRTHKIGLLADVEKMFLQIKVAKPDQDVHRYLWRNLNSDEEPHIYRMKRLTFGLNCSPFLAIATIHAHVTGYLNTCPRASRELLDNMYVDDCLTGAETDESALELKNELTMIMKAAGFNLTKWASNSQQVMDSTQSEQRESPSIVNLTTQSESTKALGVSWDLKSDCFRFVPPQEVLTSSVSPTKRTVLSHAARVFDPLGLITPFTVRVKLLFQELWRRGLDWDDPLEDDIQREWSAWQSELSKLPNVTIPRCFGEGLEGDSEVEIHGPEAVLSSLRQKFWLTQGRREVKRIIRRCVTCQKQKVKACVQKMGPLPAERVTPSLPFTHIGIDFAGPLYIKEGSNTKKSYVCIFTCASSRMIHLELTLSLTTDEFLQAFARMTGRRGLCNTIWSDNAKTFKASSKQLKKLYNGTKVECRLPADMMNQDSVKAEMSARGIRWKFITERSPWRGGWWERMVRSVKEPLRKILGKALLTYSELNTLLIKIESVVNSRPLTAVSDDPRDLEPITPAHLAIGRPLQSIPEDREDYSKDPSNKAVGRYLYLLRLLNQYWGRWQKEYLHQFNVRNKWFKEEAPVSIGDIVMVSEDNVSRVKWSLAKVEAVHPGKDGLIRTATVKTEKGRFNRPVQRLHKLEVESCSSSLQHEKRDFSSDGGETSVIKEHSSLPKIDVVPQSGGQGGEDVPAQYTTRSGRKVKRPMKLGM